MPKSINFGNGVVLIGLNNFGLVKDLYYPYPGLENHVGDNLVHKIGVYVDDQFSWLDDGSWNVRVLSQNETMASDITAQNEKIGISIHFRDVLYNEKNIFIRQIRIKNLFDGNRSLKIFFNQQFNIEETHIGDTAYYDPREEVIIHYKGRKVFLINSYFEKEGFDEYGVGLIGIEGQVGTYRDAEDGVLSGNPIEHGQVDSVIAIKLNVSSREEKSIYYWMCIGESIDTAKRLNEEVLSRNPEDIINSTINYWRAWVNVQGLDFQDLSPKLVELFKKSLIFTNAHVSKNGAIIASGDSEMLQFGRDYYRYVWPRDSSFAALSLEKAGDFNASRRFFEFCRDIITGEGYFMHKYRPDKSLGSSWHPWIRNGKAQFPIQEDETALVIYALWQHYKLSRDIEFVEEVYNSLIKKAADFMISYLDEKTGLPKASYDLWEQDYGINTFTASTVYGALISASQFADLLGKRERQNRYSEVADIIKRGILKYLYDDKEGYFYKLIDTTSVKPRINKTLDVSSIYAIFKFNVLPVDDKRVKSAIKKTLEQLEVKTNIGGIARYEGDTYHFKGGNYPGNPWIITTMWIAQYYIEAATDKKDLEKAKSYLEWAVKYASPAGTLPEQLNPFTGEHLSASPLVWSHAEYVSTVISYLEKLKEFS